MKEEDEMKDLEHPMVREIRTNGYPSGMVEGFYVCDDSLGNELYKGDEVLIMDDHKFASEEISFESYAILRMLGAEVAVYE